LRHFDVESWRVIVERRPDGGEVSEATVKLLAKGERIVATGPTAPAAALQVRLPVAALLSGGAPQRTGQVPCASPGSGTPAETGEQ
jgi:hypothetical protein